VAGLFIALFFVPLAFVQADGTAYSFNLCTLKSVSEPAKTVFPTWPLALLATIISLLALFSIFLYKKRKKQRLICIINIVFILIFCFLTGYYLWHFGKIPELGENIITNPTIWAILPAIAFIFNFMAIGKINADEKLIRSLDRIR
jgi:amino acid permease